MGKKEFQAKLAAAIASLKAGQSGAVEVPIDLEDLAMGDNSNLDSLLKDILSGGKDTKPTDDTPVPEDVVLTALAILHDLTKPEAQMQAYVEAFSHTLLVHNEIHDAPVYMTKLHDHVLDFGTAVETIATMRFGKEAFYKATKEWQDGFLTRTKAVLTEEHLSTAPEHFKKLRPKNRAN